MWCHHLFLLTTWTATTIAGTAVVDSALGTRADAASACPSLFAIEAKGIDNKTYYIGTNSQYRGISRKPLNGRPNYDQGFTHFVKDDRIYLYGRPELYANSGKCNRYGVSYEANADKLGDGNDCLTSVFVTVNPAKGCSLTLRNGASKYAYFDDYGYLYLVPKPVQQNATVFPIASFRAIVPYGAPYPPEPARPPQSNSPCPTIFNVELKGNNSKTYYMRGRDAAVDNTVVTTYRRGGAEYYINGTNFVHADSRNSILYHGIDPEYYYLQFQTKQELAELNQTQFFTPIIASVDPKKDCALTLKYKRYTTVYIEPHDRRSTFEFLYLPEPGAGPGGTGNIKITSMKTIKATGPLP